MTKEEKIAKIYEVIARKDLSFGCICKNSSGKRILRFIRKNKDGILCIRKNRTLTCLVGYIPKVIGHHVMIGDVLDWLYSNNMICEDWEGTMIKPTNLEHGWEYLSNMLDSWENKREPIDSQTDECIDFILGLI